MKSIKSKAFNAEIMSKKLSKYIAAFDYFDKTLIVLSVTSGGVSITFTSIIGAPVGIASASFSLIFSLNKGVKKKLLKITRNKKKKHTKIVMLAKSKLNSIEKLIAEALIDFEISHEEYTSIINEAESYRRLKENIRNIKSDVEKDELGETDKNTW